jgi:hypothetical protein
MDGSDTTARAGRIAALATLIVSAALFVSALLGIASIDTGADTAGSAAPAAPTRSVSIKDDGRDPDCPERDQQQRERRERGVSS